MSVTRSDRQRLASLVGSHVDLAAVAESAGELLPLSNVAARLCAALSQPDWRAKDISDIVRVDPALTARLLRAANAATHAGRVEVGTVEEALVRIGPGLAVALAVGDGVKGPFQEEVPLFGLGAGDLWRHSVACALATEESGIVCRMPTLPEAYAAALLHDAGKLALSRFADAATIEELIDRAGLLGVGPSEARSVILDVCHAQVGALMVERWDLPHVIVDAVRYHHAPLMAADPKARRLCLQLVLADAVASVVGASCDADSAPTFNPALAGSLRISQDGFANLVARVDERLEQVLDLYA